MHGPSRLSNGVKSLSPPTSPRHRHGRNKSTSTTNVGGVGRSFLNGGGGGGGTKLQNVVERLGYLLMSVTYRRRGMLLFAPLLYISGLLLYMGTLGIDVVNSGGDGSDVIGPGSIYRSPEVFQKLWPFMEAERNRSSNNMLLNAWNPKLSQGWKPCVKQTISQTGFSELPKRNGFLIIEANGGLNQQRLSICDAVAVAGLLNATLVIPIFHLNSVWRDSRCNEIVIGVLA